MQGNKFDLSIVYRVYPKVSKVPPIFPDNKFELAKLCLKSFANALQGIKAKIWIILDGCPPKYEILFKEHLKGFEFEIIKETGIGNALTFKKQMDILLTQNECELVYFAEDDYFYLPAAFTKMLTTMNENENIDFLSPYDHPDIHNLSLHNYEKNIKNIGNNDWLEVSSTTMTFMTRKSVLLRTKKVFETYLKSNYDASLWMSLTKKNAFNFYLAFKYMLTDVASFKIYVKLYLFCSSQALFGRKYKLYAPTPSLATHMDNKHLAQNIDWEEEFKKYAE